MTRQRILVSISLATLRAGEAVYLALTLDALVHVLLVCFQTVEARKVTPTNLTGDDDTAVVNLHVNIVLVGLNKLLITDCTDVLVLGLALVFNSDVCLEERFVSKHLSTLTTLAPL